MEQKSRSVSIEHLKGKKRDKLQSQKLEWQRQRVHFEPQHDKHWELEPTWWEWKYTACIQPLHVDYRQGSVWSNQDIGRQVLKVLCHSSWKMKCVERNQDCRRASPPSLLTVVAKGLHHEGPRSWHVTFGHGWKSIGMWVKVVVITQHKSSTMNHQ